MKPRDRIAVHLEVEPWLHEVLARLELGDLLDFLRGLKLDNSRHGLKSPVVVDLVDSASA